VASVPTEPVTAERFADFTEAGFAKIAESTRVDPYGERFSIVTVESRVPNRREQPAALSPLLAAGSLHEADASHADARA